MLGAYRNIIIEDKNGLQTNAGLLFNDTHGTLVPEKEMVVADIFKEITTLDVFPSGTIARNDFTLDARQLLSLGDIAIRKVRNAVTIAVRVGTKVTISLTDDDIDGDIFIGGDFSYKV